MGAPTALASWLLPLTARSPLISRHIPVAEDLIGAPIVRVQLANGRIIAALSCPIPAEEQLVAITQGVVPARHNRCA